MADLQGVIRLKAKPGMPKTELLGWDESIKAYRMNVHARPEDNKANIEIIRFLRKLTKKEVQLVSGATSRMKSLKIG